MTRPSISQVVQDEEWQALRASLVGTWKATPEASLGRLKAYLGDGKDPLKVRRVLNYLTGSGFRIGIIRPPGLQPFLAWVRSLPRA